MTNTHSTRSRWRARGASLAAVAVMASGMTLLAAAPAQAAPLDLVVDSLEVTQDATIGDGICATADGTCTLTAALQEANAVEASEDEGATDAVSITFADELTAEGPATITLPGSAANAMAPSTNLGVGGVGSHYLIDSAVPVSIDFGGDVSVVSANDFGYSVFLVRSGGVTIQNLAQLRSAETGVVVEDASGVTLRNVQMRDPDTIIMELGVLLRDGASNVTLDNVTVEGVFFSGVYFDVRANVSNVQVLNSTFLNIREAAFETGRLVNANGFTVRGSTFDGNTWGFFGRDDSFDGFTWTGNTFTRTRSEVIRIVDTQVDRALISGNTFRDQSGGGTSDIWVGFPGENNVIEDNTFLVTDEGVSNRWVVRTERGTADQAYGWAIRGNAIDGYVPGAWAPIFLNNQGILPVERNTFANARGTRSAVSENGLIWFVVNRFANGIIQTWRPVQSSVSVDDEAGTLSVTVAPVTPPIARNNPPADGPVTLDVYLTTTDDAELYLGRVSDVEGGSQTVTVPFTGELVEGSFVRVQTIDALGRSSQYSGEIDDDFDPDAPPAEPPAEVVPVVEIDEAPLEGELTGTGESAATVVVRNSDGDIVCETSVASDGSWSCTPEPALECDETYTAVQTVGGVSSEPVTFQPDGCDDGVDPVDPVDPIDPIDPIIPGPGQDPGTGVGGDGANDDDDDRVVEGGDSQLPAGGVDAGTMNAMLAGLLMLAAGAAIMARRFARV